MIDEGKNRNRIGRAQRQTLHQSTFINPMGPTRGEQPSSLVRGRPSHPPPPIAPPSQSLGGEGEKITYGVNTYCLLLKNRGTVPEFF